MRAEKIVAALLTADAGVAAIVGTGVFGGVAHEQWPAPLVVYRKRSAERGGLLAPGNDGAVVTAVLDVVCIATTYEQLKQLAEAVRQALVYQQGTVAGEHLMGIEAIDEGADEYEPELREFGQVWGYQVTYSEP